MLKPNYDFPNKLLYHDVGVGFVSQGSLNDWKNLKTMTLPGHQSLEVRTFYDRLGITRANITGLEYVHKCAVAARITGKGVNVVEEDVFDFVQSTPDVFDIIHLDYQGHMGSRQLRTLQHIFHRGLLSNYGVLITNFYGGREKSEQQNRYHHNANTVNEMIEMSFNLPEIAKFQRLGIAKPIDGIAQARDTGITQGILDIALGCSSQADILSPWYPANAEVTQLVSLKHFHPDLKGNLLKKIVLRQPETNVFYVLRVSEQLAQLPGFRNYCDADRMMIAEFLRMVEERPMVAKRMARYT